MYSLLMCEMLWEPMVATDWEEHASETAVRYSSLSAASWALRFFPMYAGRVFCVSRFTFIPLSNKKCFKKNKILIVLDRSTLTHFILTRIINFFA